MKWMGPSAALAAALLALACGGNDTASRGNDTAAPDTTRPAAGPADTPPPPVYCSASTLEAEPPPQPDLPEAVAATRAAIVRAAVACDYAALDSLAGDEGFTYSFGNGVSAGDYWRDAEARNGQPLWYLVQTLALPWFRPDSSLYAWPSVFTDEPTEEDWAMLEGIYSADEIAAYREIGFIGWRAGIAPDGEWRFFVAGD